VETGGAVLSTGVWGITPTPTPTSTPIPTPILTPTPSPTPTPTDWDKSSLVFTGACSGDCSELKAEICNSGEDMDGPSTYEVWWAVSGNPKNGSSVYTGTVDALTHDECADLTYNPANQSGNYMFKAYQRPGHSGAGVLWSEECSIACADPSPTPTIIPTPTPADNYALRFNEDRERCITQADAQVFNLAQGDWTIEAWVYPNQYNDVWVGTIYYVGTAHIGICGCASCYAGNEGKITLGVDVRNYYSNDRLVAGQWSHVAVTYDRDIRTLSFWINGQPSGSDTNVDINSTTPRQATVGGFYTIYNLEGMLDEFRFTKNVRYDAPFTPEILPGVEAETELLYHFNEGTGNIAHDASNHPGYDCELRPAVYPPGIIEGGITLGVEWFRTDIVPKEVTIVINEIAWMGTTADTGDEWLELYNASPVNINLTGWKLIAADGDPEIALSGTLAAGGYYLIEKQHEETTDVASDLIYSSSLMENGGEVLLLIGPDGNTIDTANVGNCPWPAGDNTDKTSMERCNPLEPDTDSNWQSNNKVKHNGQDSAGGDIYGTPKTENSCYDGS